MKILRWCCLVNAVLTIPAFFCGMLAAKSPAVIAEGRQLFEKKWSQRNPVLGSDGLGPLFNGESCSGCHNQSGVGGGGGAEFNAKSIGIDRMQITGGGITNDVVAAAVSNFHPGFVSDGAVINSYPLAHHGGTPIFDRSRSAMMEQLSAKFSSKGGALNAEEVRQANATPILYSGQLGKNKFSISARMFQRNTPALFGSGLIDQVRAKDLESIVKAQRQHPEISGRLSTLRDGRVGRFGWRGNVGSLIDFCDQACAAELGLETQRMNQPLDPTTPDYRNPSIDISDNQIRAMAEFVGVLPQPTRVIPADSMKRNSVFRGEQLFNQIGCAVCHVANVGPAKGIYSDLLLHDMGYELRDCNSAKVHILKFTPVSNYNVVASLTQEQRTTSVDDTVSMTGKYYGGSVSMTLKADVERVSPTSSETSGNFRLKRRGMRRRGSPTVDQYEFVAPISASSGFRVVSLDRKRMSSTNTDQSVTTERKEAGFSRNIGGWTRTKTASGRDFYNETTTKTRTTTNVVERHDYVRIHIESTPVTQEWRTPPLWGVADSAPYMHDGRAETLLEAVAMHDGESAGTRDRFLNLSLPDREAIFAFLDTMVAPKGLPQVANID